MHYTKWFNDCNKATGVWNDPKLVADTPSLASVNNNMVVAHRSDGSGATFVAEYAPRWLGAPVSFVVEPLAVVPSVISGLWGFFVLAPLLRAHVEPAQQNTIWQLPVVGAPFSGPILGRDLLIGGVILAARGAHGGKPHLAEWLFRGPGGGVGGRAHALSSSRSNRTVRPPSPGGSTPPRPS